MAACPEAIQYDERTTLVVDKENKTISFDKIVWEKFCPYGDWKSLVSDINYNIKGNSYPYGHKPKDIAQGFTKDFGITPTKLYKKFMYEMYAMWVDPHKDIVNMMFYSYDKKADIRMVQQLHDILPLVEQTKKDGNNHILPLVVFFQRDTKELRGMFGRSLWKSLCNNSKTKNVNLVKYLHNLEVWTSLNKSDVYEIGVANSLPSTILKKSYLIRPRELKYVYENTGKQVKDFILNEGRATFTQDEKSILDMVIDTVGMAEQVGEEVNFNWSVRRMKEEHDRLTREINLKRLGYDTFDIPEGFPRIVKNNFVKATLIETPDRLLQEGVDMRHCVFSFANSIKMGRYLVYSVESVNGYRSTLGLTISDNEANINQHYVAENSVVEDEEHHKIAREIEFKVCEILSFKNHPLYFD